MTHAKNATTVKPSDPCNLCGDRSFRILFKKEGRNIVKCDNCGLVCVNPQNADEEVNRVYQEDYFKRGQTGVGYRNYIEDEILHSRTFQREFGLIEKTVKNGKCLDIGCAAGFSLAVARSRGWETYGVELSRSASDYARRVLGLEVFTGKIEEAHYPDSFFDLVISYGTIEHVVNPSAFLEETHRILKEEGLFVCSTPDIDSWLGNRKFQYKPDEHLYYFTRDTITKMLGNAGLEVLQVRKMKIFRSIYFFLERLEYYFQSLTPLLSVMKSIAITTGVADFSFFVHDGQMVVYAKKISAGGRAMPAP